MPDPNTTACGSDCTPAYKLAGCVHVIIREVYGVCRVVMSFSAHPSMQVRCGHKSVTRSAAVACTSRSTHHLAIRATRSTSVAALKQGRGQAFVGRLSKLLSDRPRSMTFKHLSLSWLAGAAVISAVAAQSAYGTASSNAVAIRQQVRV